MKWAFGQARKPVRYRKAIATKAQANYRSTNGDISKPHCDVCTMYHETWEGTEGTGGNCTAVQGDIHSLDVCDFFEPKYAKWQRRVQERNAIKKQLGIEEWHKLPGGK